jgi:hypothetical protein
MWTSIKLLPRPVPATITPSSPFPRPPLVNLSTSSNPVVIGFLVRSLYLSSKSNLKSCPKLLSAPSLRAVSISF